MFLGEPLNFDYALVGGVLPLIGWDHPPDKLDGAIVGQISSIYNDFNYILQRGNHCCAQFKLPFAGYSSNVSIRAESVYRYITQIFVHGTAT